jgi:hypothetical protein
MDILLVTLKTEHLGARTHKPNFMKIWQMVYLLILDQGGILGRDIRQGGILLILSKEHLIM